VFFNTFKDNLMKRFFAAEQLNSFKTFSIVKTLLLAIALLGGVSAWAQTTYTWNGGNGLWVTTTNWSPNGTPGATDTVVFDDGGSSTVTIAANTSVGKVIVTNNSTFTIGSTTATARLLTIAGGGGVMGLQVDAGSTLSNTAANIGQITLTNNGQIADVAGTLDWNGGTFTATGNTVNVSGTMNTSGTSIITLAASATTAFNLSGTLNYGSTGSSTMLGGNITGTFNMNSGTVTMNNATYPAAFTSTGVLNHTAGTIAGSVAGGIVFQSGSNYNYLGTGGLALPLASWDTNSNINITGITAAASITNINTQSFGNITYNCVNQGNTITTLGSTAATYTVKGDFNILSTGSGSGSLTLKSLTTSGTVNATFNGAFNLVGGTVNACTAATTALTLNLNGGYTQTGGTFNLSTAAIACTMNIGADYILSGGTFTQTSTTASKIIFNGTGTYAVTGSATLTNTNFNYEVNGGSTRTLNSQLDIAALKTLTVSNGSLATAGTLVLNGNDVLFASAGSLTVNNFGTINCGTTAAIKNTTGATTFSIAAGGTMYIGSPAGITSSGATGNIQVTGTRTFNVGAHYVYVGTNGQVTGNGLPASVTGSVTVNLSDGGALSITNSPASVTIGLNGTLRMVKGSLANSARFVNGLATLEYAGTAAAQTTSDNEWPSVFPNAPYNLNINNPYGVTLHAARTLGSTGSLTLNQGLLNTTATNLLTIANTNASTSTYGGSATSYVNGPLARNFNGTSAPYLFRFPVGKTNYAEMVVSLGLTGVTTYVAEYFESAPTAAPGIGLSAVGSSYWSLLRTSGSGIFTNVNFTFAKDGIVTASRIGYSPDNSSTPFTNIGGSGPGTSIASLAHTMGPNGYFTIGTAGTLSGTITSYTTLTSIAAALQTMLVTDDVVFELPTSYAGEPAYPVVFSPFNEDGNGPYNVTIRPAAGSSNFLTAGDPGTGNPLINLNGIDRLTIDGRAGGVGNNVWTFRNTRTATVVGSTFQFINDATYNTLTYLNVEGQNITATSGTILFSTAAALGNSNNTISYCDIHENTVTGTTPANGIYSVGTASFSNANNIVSNNRIYNNFVAGATGAGVWIGLNNIAWTITNNHFYQTATRTSTGAVVRYAIYINNTNAGSDNFIISDNYIGGSEENAAGSPYTITAGAVAQAFRAIDVSFNTSATNCLISNNVIRNITIGHGSTTATVVFAGIYSSNGTQQIFGNTIGSTNGTNLITVTTVGTGLNNIYGIFIAAGVDTVYNNTIAGLRLPNTSGLCSMTGIHLVTTGNAFVNNNTIGDFDNSYTGTGAAFMRGINTNGTGINTITNNTIYGLRSAANYAGTLASAVVIGILDASTASSPADSQIISGNTIHSLSNSHATSSVHVMGIYLANPTSLTNRIAQCDGNFIHSLSLNTSSTTSTISGIHLASGVGYFYNNMIRLGIDSTGTALTNGYLIYGINNASTTTGNASVHNKFYHNSVYVGGTGVSGANKTFAYYRSAASTYLDIRNNIFINARSNGSGTGSHFAIGFTAVPTVAHLTLNNNLYNYAGTGGIMAEMPTNTTFSTFIDWQAYWQSNGPKEGNSLAGEAGFINVDGNASQVNLHINPAQASPIESAGQDVGIVFDFDHQERSALTPTDIGADAGAFSALDVALPVIVFTPPFGSCNSETTFTISDVIITDASSSINITPGTKPRLYFKKSTDADVLANWHNVEANGSSSPFDFTITLTTLGTLNGGDIIQYFVVAQDEGPDVYSPNVAINGGSFAVTPLSVSLTSSAFPIGGILNTFAILPCNGSVTVGVGGSYSSLTNDGGLFQALNESTLSANVTATIISDLSEIGTHALNQWNETGTGNYTVTIRPDANITRTISGNYNGAAGTAGLIRINGADRVVFDGRNPSDLGANGRHLIFRNTNATSSSNNNATIYVLNDANNLTFRNLIIEGATVGTLNGVFRIDAAGAGDGNDYITITENQIRDRSDAGGIPTNGLFIVGAFNEVNDNITIANNEIFNYHAATQNAGVNIGSYNSDFVITGNSIFDQGVRTTASDKYGIIVDANTGSGINFNVSNNYIGGNASGATGTWTVNATGTTDYRFAGILISCALNSNSVVSNNIIRNFNITTGSVFQNLSSLFSGIYATNGDAVISDNTIGGSSGNISIISTNTSALGFVHGIYHSGNGPVTITGNTIGGFSVSNSTSSAGIRQMVGIRAATNSTSDLINVSNNTIGGSLSTMVNSTGNTYISSSAIMNAGIYVTSAQHTVIIGNNVSHFGYHANGNSTSGGMKVAGIYRESAAAVNTITGNVVNNITSQSPYAGTGANVGLSGIYVASSSNNQLISQNEIYSISNTNTTSVAPAIYGIYYVSGTQATNHVSRNLIHSLQSSTTGASDISGIYIGTGAVTVSNNMIRLGLDNTGNSIATTSMFQGIVKNNTSINNRIYYNSVYIGGTGVGTASVSTYALRRLGYNAADDVRNNIFVNARSNASTGGKHYGVHLNNASSFTMRNNLIHASGSGNVFGGISTTDYPNLSIWMPTGFGQNTVSADPQFIAPTAAVPDLHLIIGSSSPAESGAEAIEGMEDDFDSTGVRSVYPQTNSYGGGMSPDMGADETDMAPVDLIAPVVIVNAIPSQSIACSTNISITVTATVSDAMSGVATGVLAPKLWWRLSTGTYTSLAPSSVVGNLYTYDLTITGASAGDVYQYYVAAQDAVGNMGYSHHNASSPVHADVASTPSVLNAVPATFVVNVNLPLSGTITVGIGGDFTSLTKADGLFSAINSRGLSGDLKVKVISNTSEDGNQPLNMWTEHCGSNYRVTILPSDATVKTLTGSYFGIGMFSIYGERVTIDGQYGGEGRYLKFENTYASSNGSQNSTFRFGSGTAWLSSDTLRYCDIIGASSKTAGAVIHMLNTSGLVIENNLIHGGSAGAYNILRADGGSNNTIANNEIYNFLGWSGAMATAIWIEGGNGNNWKITGNSIFNTYINGQGEERGIYFNPGTLSNGNVISGNFIGGSAANCGGSFFWRNNYGGDLVPLYINVGSDNENPTQVKNNKISRIDMQTGDGSGITCVLIQNGRIDFDSNIIGDSLLVNQILTGAQPTTTGTGWVYGIESRTSSLLNITNNLFGGLASVGSIRSYANIIEHSGSGTLNITDNFITGCYTGANTIYYTGVNMKGIAISSGMNHIIARNTIRQLGNAGSPTTGVFVDGIQITGTASADIFDNELSDFFHLNSGGSSSGIILAGTGSRNVYNNIISMSNSGWLGAYTSRKSVNGILDYTTGSGTQNILYNTIYITGQQTGTSGLDYLSVGYYRLPNGNGSTTGSNVVLRNNIIVNDRTGNPTVSSLHYCIYNASSSPATGWNSNYNLFAGTNGNHIGYWQGAGNRNFAQWQSSSSGDANSLSAGITTGSTTTSSLNPTELFANPSVGNLRILASNAAFNNFVNDKGTSISILVDIDGESRDALTPDIGVDEFDGCAMPLVTTQPSNQNVCEGTAVQLAVANNGQSPFTYKWQVDTGSGWSDLTNGGVYSGVDNDTLNISSVAAIMNGYQFRVVITNDCGTVTSNSAAITVVAAPQILTYSPPSLTNNICALSNTSFAVTASGNGLTYAWQVSTDEGDNWSTIANAAPYSGTTTSALAISNTPSSLHGNYYRVIVGGTCAPADTSDNMVLNVGDVTIITQPVASTVICSGGNGMVTVVASGNSVSYLWQVNTGSGFVNITNNSVYSGATTDTLHITGATAAMNNYTYRVLVGSVGCGTLTSNSSVLTIQALPTASVVGNTVICSGEEASIGFMGTANAVVSYNVNGGSTQNITLNASGMALLNTGALTSTTTYNLVSVALNGCSQPLTGSAQVVIVPSPTASISATITSLCAGSSSQVNFTGGPAYGEVTYTVNSGANQYISLDENGEAVLNTGVLNASRTYTLVSVMGDYCEIPVTGSVSITVSSEPEASAGADIIASCDDASVTLSGASASGGTILWTTSGNGTFNNATLQNPVYTLGTMDDFSLTLTMTITGAVGCGNAVDQVVINIAQPIWYADTDGDGYGDASATPNCTGGAGYVDNNLDFCDSNAALNPATVWWVDNDGDSYGVYAQTVGDLGVGCATTYNMMGVGTLVILGGDCNDTNANIHPGATEVCHNGIDDNCNGIQNEGGCPAVAPPANDNPLSSNPNLGLPTNVYPNCVEVAGTTIGATTNPATGTRDVWYRFEAISNGVSVQVSSTVIDPIIYLFDASNLTTPLNVENIITGTGTEILNFSNLTAGNWYRIAIASASEADGTFSICARQLRVPQCQTSGTQSMCAMAYSAVTGAPTTTVTMTDVVTSVTTSHTFSGNSVQLSTPSLGLRYESGYNVHFTATYPLVNGLGQPEVVAVPGTSTCTVTIAPHALIEVKANSRCSSTTLARTAVLNGNYLSGANCNFSNFRFEFTPVDNCAGANPRYDETFTKTVTATAPNININYAFNQMSTSSYPATGYWLVRIRPRFTGYEGEYGPAHVIAVRNTATASGMALQPNLEPAKGVNTMGNIEANIYPNPNNGELVNLNITGITSNEVYVRLIDSMGREVYTNRYSVDGTLNTMVSFTRPLAQGVYMVEMRAGEDVKTQRMIVTK
jgi:hypothetical protein